MPRERPGRAGSGSRGAAAGCHATWACGVEVQAAAGEGCAQSAVWQRVQCAWVDVCDK